MPDQLNDQLIERLQAKYAESTYKYQIEIRQDDNWRKFIARFPAENLHTLSLEDYCLGRGSQPESFSWYIERGLHAALGRYSPGSSKGHLIYRKPDGSYYRTKNFDGKNNKEALDIVLRATQLIGLSQSLADAERWDTNEAISEELKCDVRISMGPARKLRIFHAYHPDEMLSINSPEHLKHFLKIFGFDESALPNSPFALAKLLWEYYLSIKGNFAGVTPKGFSVLLYENDLGIRPKKREKFTNTNEDLEVVDIVEIPRNTILYGPPGTGKTYETVTRAVQILDKGYFLEHQDNRLEIHNRYTDLINRGYISFVTFHQSFSYEEFVEGLKVQTDDDGSLRYEVEDGIFKTLCTSAASKVTAGDNNSVSLTGKRIWKMSLGNTLGDDAFIFDECIDSSYILLGYGNGVDFSNTSSKSEILERYKDSGFDYTINDYAVTSITRFIFEIQIGDIVVITDGNRKFRAIGQISSDYAFHTRTDQLTYTQKRNVNWLRAYSPSRPFEDLMNNIFSQMTLYELKEQSISLSKLADLLSSPVKDQSTSVESNARVMIIDEINRGNISRIFGELITLVEDNKRAGQNEALQIRLPYSKKLFSVPDNLYIIGTMNTADRSLTGMDTALRRRFNFTEVEPDPDLLAVVNVDGIEVSQLLTIINQRIELLLGREFLLGHSYFLPLVEDPSMTKLSHIFSTAIIPQLREYFFDDWEKIHRVLGDHQKQTRYQIITKKYNDDQVDRLLGSSWQHGAEEIWQVNDEALDEFESYVGIYNGQSGINDESGSSDSS